MAISPPDVAARVDRLPSTGHPLSKGWAAAVGVLVVAGMVLAVVLDHGRAWVTPDGATYLGVANNLAHGHGLTSPFRNTLNTFSATPSTTVPFVHWPPGYPVVLALFVVVGTPPLVAAELVNVLAVGALIWLAAAIAWCLTCRPIPMLVLAGVVTASVTVVELSRYALSDLAFLALCAGLLLAALRTLQGRPRALWAMTIVVCAAELVRWAGVALLVVAVVAALLAGRRRDAAWVAAIPLAIAVAWQAVLLGTAGHGTRSLVWHPPLNASGLVRGIAVLFAPAASSSRWEMVLGISVLAVFALLAVLALLALRSRSDPFRIVLITFLGSYGVVLIFSRLLVDAEIPWDLRILAPIYLATLLLLFDIACTGAVVGRHADADADAAATIATATRPGRRWAAPAAVVALCALVLGQLWSWPSLMAQASTPQSLSAPYWQQMPMGALAASLRPYRTVASNHPDVVSFWLGRSALTLPDRVDPITTVANHHITDQLQALSKTLDGDGALVLFVDPSNPRTYLVAGQSVVAACGLHLVASFNGAAVYAH